MIARSTVCCIRTYNTQQYDRRKPVRCEQDGTNTTAAVGGNVRTVWCSYLYPNDPCNTVQRGIFYMYQVYTAVLLSVFNAW